MKMQRKAILLGASSGIGKEMALQLASLGWKVAITGRRKNLLEETVASKPDAIFASAFDADITELRPGSVDTNMMKGEGHFWISTPQDAARLACEAIRKGKRLQYISKRWLLIGFVVRCMSLLK
jgi:short-subunit dehydrogenase